MDALPTGSPRLRASAEQLLDEVAPLLGLSGAQTVEEARRALATPALIAVAGRVNTGKSTLVNSLISVKLAPTSAQEATALLTYYVYGSPSRAEAALGSGHVVPIPVTGSGPALGNIRPETVDFLRVYVQAAALENSTILDTPGLESAVTGNSARTASGMLEERESSVDPDVLLYLVRDAFRPDDEEFIAAFRARQGAGPDRPVIGLLARADNFGAGPWHTADPIDEARKAAADLAKRMPQLTSVLAVSGLLAETARTGALREQDVRGLRALRGVDDGHLQFRDQLGPPPGARMEDLQRLTGLIGSYGLRFGREHCDDAGTLTEWLLDRSGLARLERVLRDEVTGPTDCARVDEMLRMLLAAGRAQSWPAEARALIESARHAPAFHRLHEEEALALLRGSAPDHALVPVLEGLRQADWRPPTIGPAAPEKIGYLELASHYQAMAGTATTGAEARAARVIARSLLIRSGAGRTPA